MVHRQLRASESAESARFTIREKEFLRLACTDLTHRQVAEIMSPSKRTVDGYREALFHKLNVHSRVGLAKEAIRIQLIRV
jgi:DNA-binding CsgD family transcriptional regulator